MNITLQAVEIESLKRSGYVAQLSLDASLGELGGSMFVTVETLQALYAAAHEIITALPQRKLPPQRVAWLVPAERSVEIDRSLLYPR